MKNQNFNRQLTTHQPVKVLQIFEASTNSLKSSEECSTQTSRTIVQFTSTGGSGSMSPDSLASSPRQSIEFRTKSLSLTQRSLDKSKILQTPLDYTIRPSDSYETKFIKTESLDNYNYCHPNFVQDTDSERKSFSVRLQEKSYVDFNFMLPTLASEQKNHLRDVERARKLLPALRRGRSLSPQMCRSDWNARKIPYIDQSATNVSSITTLVNVKREPNRLPNWKDNEKRYDENLLKINFKTSLEELCDSTGRSSACSVDSIIPSLITKLRDKDWNVALKGLAEIIEIARISGPTFVHPYMAAVYQKIIELLRSPRTYVCRTACQASGHLFEYVKDTRRPEFDEIVDTLLSKTADANKFIRYDANLALDCMVTHIQTTIAIRCLCNKGPIHKNPLVRTATVRLLICSILINGPTYLLNSHINESTKQRIFINLGRFLDDKNLETRKLAERLYKILCRETMFDFYLKRYLNNEQINKIKKTLKLVQKTPK